MNINPVSFGKTVRVHAPYHEALRIANYANGAPIEISGAQKQLIGLFDDVDEGSAVAFSFDDNSNDCYIFSGKESREYIHNVFQRALTIRDAKMNYPLKEALPKVLRAKEEFFNKTAELIKRTKSDIELKIDSTDE